ncbi:ribonuclease H1 [Byssothecium circinans]|uniref:ribonuclease H n=1 Tax=Byssothecium circinans TaxID=147558 RepID=A0A6A5UI65_9PLEO|nr:ribonuclease H1 [Byssothecium circinans]
MVYVMVFQVDGGCRRNGYSDAIGAAACSLKHRSGSYTTWTRNLPTGTYNTLPTSQRAEITAIILALELALKKYDELDGNPYLDVTIKSDSRYAVGCMTDWIYKWTENGWRNARGDEVANRDLIEMASRLDDRLKEEGEVTYVWIPRSENEVADEACGRALDQQEQDQMSCDSDSDYY